MPEPEGAALDAAAHAWGVAACATAWLPLAALGPAGVFGPAVVEPGLALGLGLGRAMACSAKTPSRPTSPVTSPDTEVGTEGDDVLTTAWAWSGACTCSSGVAKAAETA